MKHDPRFSMRYGPWALVTGASSGIGREFARALAKKGLNLVLAARRAERLESLAAELGKENGVEARPISVDLSEEGYLAEVIEKTDGIEIGLLVNNAGVALEGEFLDHELEAEIATVRLNCEAPTVLARHFGTKMKQRRRGGIIFLASTVAHVGMARWSTYCATKGYCLQIAEGLAGELGKDGVNVLAVCPGTTRTELLELTRFGKLLSMEPSDVARIGLRSLGRSRHVTTGVVNKVTVFLTRLLPRAWNSMIFRAVLDRVESPRAIQSRASR